jgi:hypothetical protein
MLSAMICNVFVVIVKHITTFSNRFWATIDGGMLGGAVTLWSSHPLCAHLLVPSVTGYPSASNESPTWWFTPSPRWKSSCRHQPIGQAGQTTSSCVTFYSLAHSDSAASSISWLLWRSGSIIRSTSNTHQTPTNSQVSIRFRSQNRAKTLDNQLQALNWTRSRGSGRYDSASRGWAVYTLAHGITHCY